MDVQKQLLEMDMEEDAMMDVREQLKHPVIIAMKGHHCTGKSTIARVLAGFLGYPIIAQDDLLDYAGDKSFEAICRIAATQLIRIRVIIDSSLTSQAHRDRLVQLAESTRARLIIVECRPSDEYEWRQRLERRAIFDQSYKPSTWGDLQKMLGKYEDYDVGAVPKLILDTTKVFKEGVLVSAILAIAFYRNPHVVELDQWEDLVTSLRMSKRSKEERGRYRHSHTLGLSNEGKDTKGTCNICSELVSGQAYDCDECEFILHKFCAELSDKVQRLPDECPPFLRAIPPVYTFPEKHVCDACKEAKKGFSDECLDCLFLTHLKCKLLPTILHHECHEHPLRFEISPLNSNFKFICRACGHFGGGIVYSCGRCRLHFHVSCLLLPRTLKHRTHRDPLTLNYFPPNDGSSEYYCNACEGERKPSHWIYYCADHEFAAHMSCMTPEVRPYDMQNDKRLDILKM
ncbi:hypothetical protein Acr_11g0005500 [Actinidia rufa]|uniref:Phorbol-ester/DAG-type domain-containing protein n=1 Tax=Actinidia rufa TaxID=165716 RepID=A0A7J0FC07_9ERIC|nr:hypothetical protein Acr_11g0005500 [Actinidia rufa]